MNPIRIEMSNVGLVLSGGMAKGAYQVGALRAINEYFKLSDFSVISSASVGALNTYAYLTNGLDKVTDLWNAINSSNYRKWITTILKGCFLQDAIKSLLSDVEISNTFYIPLMNLRKRKLLYADIGKVPNGSIESYLRASVAMPAYNPPVRINGESYFDGAVIDNIPIYPTLKHNIDYMICIYFDNFNYTFENNYLNNKIIAMNFTDNKIVSSSICFKRESIRYMIDEGYRKAKRILDYVLANGMEDTTTIYARIEDLNALNNNRSLRLTGDVVVNNMNKITKKFMRKTEIN